MEKNNVYSLSAEDFIERYMKPAVTDLVHRVKSGGPLSDLDRKILIGCGYDPDELLAFYKTFGQKPELD